MKKSLIKSLLPVLIVVLALSMISITVVADNYTGYVYDPENPCETIDQIKYDGLNRVKTALEPAEDNGKFDGLREPVVCPPVDCVIEDGLADDIDGLA